MNVLDAIRERRSIKRFTDETPDETLIQTLLDAAISAPNHRLTNPWRFYVLGPEAREAWGAALGERKARKAGDAEAAQAIRHRTAVEYRDLPCMIAVATVLSDNPEIREEDYGATMMAVQNIALAAIEVGLGTHIRTGAVMEDPAARASVGVPPGQRIVATVSVGRPAEVPPARARVPAADLTSRVP